MRNKDFYPDPKKTLDTSDDFASFLQTEGVRESASLSRAPVKGAVQIAFWGLRRYYCRHVDTGDNWLYPRDALIRVRAY